MPTADDLRQKIDQISIFMAAFVRDGAVSAEDQAEYAELAQRKAALQSELAALTGAVPPGTVTPVSIWASVAPTPLAPAVSGEPAPAASPVISPTSVAAAPAPARVTPSSALPESNEPQDYDAATCDDYLNRALAAQREKRWDAAREAANTASLFARGPQVAFIETFFKTIDRQQAEAEAAAADENISRLMAEARELSFQALYPAAIEKAQEAVKSARPERKGDAQTLLEDIQRSQEEAAQSLVAQVRVSLQEKRLEDAQQQLTQLRGVRPDLPAFVQLTEEYNKDWKAIVLARILKQGTDEIEQLLKPKTMVEARQARSRARDLTAEYPEVEEFKVLYKRASQAEEDAKNYWHEATSSSLQGGEFESTLRAMEIARSEGATELPLYDLALSISPTGQIQVLGGVTGYAKADEAIASFRAGVSRFSSEKAREYKTRAEVELQRNPRLAKRLITEAIEFYRLPEDNKKALQDFLARQIEGRVRDRAWVEQQCELALKNTDPLAAWKQLRQAAPRDPYTPQLEEARAALRPQVVAWATEQLRRANEMLQRPEEWPDAAGRAAEVRDLLEGDGQSAALQQEAAALAGKALRFQELRTQIARQKADLDALVQRDPQAADERLRRLLEDAGKNASYFPELAGWGDAVKARTDWRGALAQIESGYRDLSESDLSQRITRLAALRGSATPADLPLLEDAERRLELRSKFLRADRQYRAGPAFWDDAEPLLREVASAGKEDAKAAETDVAEIDKVHKRAEEAKVALEAAETLAKVRSFDSAILMLQPHRDQTGKVGSDVRQRMRDYSTEWQETIQKQLDFQKSQSSLPSLEDMENKVAQLKKLTPVPGGEWELANMPAVYARAAKTAREPDGLGLTKALQLLDKALALAPDLQPLQRERRDVARLLAEQYVATVRAQRTERLAEGLAQAETRWTEFAQKYPDDIKAYIELGKLATDQSNYEQALRYLDAAMHLNQDQNGPYMPTISNLRTRAEELLDVQETQAKIRKLLVKEKDAPHYKTASLELEQLVQRYPARKAELEPWLTELKESLAAALAKDLDALAPNAEERWHLALKIMILNPLLPQAKAELDRAIREVGELKQETGRLVVDEVGPLDGPDDKGKKQLVDASQALNKQIEQAHKLANRAYRITELLDLHARLVSQVDEQREARECRKKIQDRLLDLDKLEALVRRGRGQLAAACGRVFIPQLQGGDDPFKTVSDTLGDIKGESVSFDKHRTVDALKKDLLQAKTRRDDLQEEIQQLEAAVNAEDFDQALGCINRIRDLDPNNDFDVMGNVRIHDPFTRRLLPIATIHQRQESLERQMQARQEQWQQIEAWQKPMGLAGWERGKPVPLACHRLSWAQDGAALCQAAWQAGSFNEAQKLMQDAIGTEESEAGVLAPRWSLRRCKKYLLDAQVKEGPLPVLTDASLARSEKARKIFQARSEALEQVESDIRLLAGPRADGALCELDRLKQEQERFYMLFEAIGDGLGRLQSGGLLRRLRGADRAALCDEIRENARAARAIAPKYPGLVQLLPSVEAECGGLQ